MSQRDSQTLETTKTRRAPKVRELLGFLLVAGNLGLCFFSVLGALVPSWAWATTCGGIMIAFWSRTRRAARTSLFIAAMALGLAWVAEIPTAPAFRAFGYFTGFLFALNLLSNVIRRAAGIGQLAALLLRRGPAERYYYLAAITHLLSLLLNVGAAMLMLSLLAQDMRQASSVHKRLLGMAILMGFSATMLWSPLSAAVLLTLSIADSVNYIHLASLGILASIVYLVAGYLTFARLGQDLHTPALPQSRHAFPLKATLGTAGLVALLIAILATLSPLMGLLASAMVAATTLALPMLAVQSSSESRPVRAAVHQAFLAASGIANEVAIIGGASFAGNLMATFVGSLAIAANALPLWVITTICACLPTIVFLFGVVGINPVLGLTVLCGLLVPLWPETGRLWLLLALLIGGCLSAIAVPASGVMQLAAQKAGLAPREVRNQWSLRFSTQGLVIAGGICAAALFGTQIVQKL